MLRTVIKPLSIVLAQLFHLGKPIHRQPTGLGEGYPGHSYNNPLKPDPDFLVPDQKHLGT